MQNFLNLDNFSDICQYEQKRLSQDDKEYTQPRHGFGKLVDFKLVGKTGDRLTFAFIDNEETFKNYPFHFNLAVSYRLAGNELHVIWHVENTDDKVIYFQIGGHLRIVL